MLSIDGYSDFRVIGHGGFATVYFAHHHALGRDVAVKVLAVDLSDDRAARRFRREVDATARLSGHPNVIGALDAGVTNHGQPFLTMPYCPEGTLHDRLAREGPLPVAAVMDIGGRLAGALLAVHDSGLLHRDIKPQNVLLTPWGEPALADFGIATVLDIGQRTGTTDSLTPLHTAPEILAGQPPTPASDVYSLGSTLYTLLAGRPPFAGAADEGVYFLMNRVMSDLPPALGPYGVPGDVESLLASMLAKDPARRPRSGDLAALLAGAASAGAWGESGSLTSQQPATLTSPPGAADSWSRPPEPVVAAQTQVVHQGVRQQIAAPHGAAPPLPTGANPLPATSRTVSTGPLLVAVGTAVALVAFGVVWLLGRGDSSSVSSGDGVTSAPRDTVDDTATEANDSADESAGLPGTTPSVAVAPPSSVIRLPAVLAPAGASAPESRASARSKCESGVTYTYTPANVIDGDVDTGWGVAGDGRGATVTIDLTSPQRVTKVGLTPGYTKIGPRQEAGCADVSMFERNRQLTAARVWFDDGSSETFDVPTIPDLQYLELTEPHVTSSITVEIISTIRPAGADDDTIVSEIEVWGSPP